MYWYQSHSLVFIRTGNTWNEMALSQKTALCVLCGLQKGLWQNKPHTFMAMHSIGVSQRIIAVLQSMYASASSCIRISSNEATDLFKCPRGIRHGCILSPLLHSRVGKRITMRELNFSMVIRNILDIIMYADDVVLLKCCRSKETHHHLIRLFPKEETISQYR